MSESVVSMLGGSVHFTSYQIKGQPNRRRKLVWKLRKCENIFICMLDMVVLSKFINTHLFLRNLDSTSCSHDDLLFAIEEQKNVDPWRIWNFCHTCHTFGDVTDTGWWTQNDYAHASVDATLKGRLSKQTNKQTNKQKIQTGNRVKKCCVYIIFISFLLPGRVCRTSLGRFSFKLLMGIWSSSTTGKSGVTGWHYSV